MKHLAACVATTTTVTIATLLAFAASAAHAQSSVTLYGVADASVRYLKGANAGNDGVLSLTNGAISQSRWGLVGSEDLGHGLSAIFRLESGFSLPNGASSVSGVLFNRYAYVGLASATYGTLTFGQQQNAVYQNLTEGWDPLTVGNYLQNEWLPIAFSGFLRGENNTAFYTWRRGRLAIRGAYGLGNQAGDFSANSMRSVSVTIDPEPLGAEIGYVDAHDLSNRAQTSYNVQLRYRAYPAEAWLGYYHSRDETGRVNAFLTGTAAPNVVNPRWDNAYVAGLSWFLAPDFKLTNAFYFDQSRKTPPGASTTDSGHRYALVALAEYLLSKRTTLYATVDYNRVSGAADDEMPNRKYQTGVSVGLRNRF
ncbi:porin [Paraburkholderia antibiotica]|uniref:Porin n=1 Tax=Paraburkholderia antibiotica TaxID=2728839 RepID=A0A7Y0A0E6_9BURK|nr:porin [Paraburkholderia antibiotica]NML34191.1 porin [Paraburkholderia antibiotica]